MDRIDLHIEVPAVHYEDLKQPSSGESSSVIRARIEEARAIQSRRFSDHRKGANRKRSSVAGGNGGNGGSAATGPFCNAHMTTREIRKYCAFGEEASAMLDNAMTALSLSARAYDRILKVARTIADLGQCENIEAAHMAEAIQYRSLDRGN